MTVSPVPSPASSPADAARRRFGGFSLGGGAPGESRKGGKWALAVKAAVSVGLLAWLATYTDVDAAAARLAEASWGWLAAGFAVKSLSIPMAALRWRTVAAAAGAVFSRFSALRVTMASLFLGQALPGALGGDVVRGWLTTRMGFAVAPVMLALAADRAAALAGVAVLTVAGLPRLSASAPTELVAAAGAACAVVALAVAAVAFPARLPAPGFLRRRPAVAAVLNAAEDMRRSLLSRSGFGWAALGWSVAVHVCTVAAAWCFARALALPMSPLDALAVVPFSIVAAALPVSLAGWGVREGSLAAGFALLGLGAESGVAVSLLIGVSVLIASTPGALVWISWRPAAARTAAVETAAVETATETAVPKNPTAVP